MSAPTEDDVVAHLRQIDPDWDEARVERSLQGLHRRARRRTLLGRAAWTTLVGAGAAAALAAFQLGQTEPPPLAAPTALPAEANAPPDETRTVLADGSNIRRDPSAKVEVFERSQTETRVELAQGHIALDVTRRPERAFVVDAGRFLVLVVGTRFEVDRREEGVEVRVTDGHVKVSTREGELLAELRAGERRLFEYRDETASEGQPSVAVSAPVVAATRAHPDWRPVARKGGYEEAYDLLRKAGAGAVNDTVDDLLLAADSARLSGHQAQALPYLEKVVTQHEGDARSAMAAFTRGRILLNLGRAASAAAAFEDALRLGANGSLRENALARAVEAHGRGGNARAQALARTYVAEYPQGRWLAAVREHGRLE